MEPLRESARALNFDTSYRPSHRRALSEGDEFADTDIVGDKALLAEPMEPYDERGYSRRSISADAFERTRNTPAEKTSLNPSDADLHDNKHSWDLSKILARIRVVLTVLALLGSALVLGCNANMIVTYRANTKAGKTLLTSSGAAMGWWPAWPPALDLTPSWAFIITGALSTSVILVLVLASFTKRFRYLENTFLSFVTAATSLLLGGGWVAVSTLSYFSRKNVEADLAEWACWHTNDEQFAVPGFSFPAMCAESNISKFGSFAVAGFNIFIFATIIAGCFFIRSRRSGVSYEKLAP